MLTGLPPWYNRDRKKMFAGIRGGDLHFPEHVPVDAQSLLRALLNRNPTQRLGATAGKIEERERERERRERERRKGWFLPGLL